MVLATTTSVHDAGLLDTLLPPFERATGIPVRVLVVGSGQAMALGRRGEADILILHDPAGETTFMAGGFGIDRRYLMMNEFVLVGPPDDPAGVVGMGVTESFRLIAAAGARFVSRGDRSGTHSRERMVWDLTGLAPGGQWYRESGQGMGATLVIADQLRAYTLTDIGTWLASRAPLALDILVEDQRVLGNPYHVVLVNPEGHPRVRSAEARALADWLVSPEAQAIIGSFRVGESGRSLFTPALRDTAARPARN